MLMPVSVAAVTVMPMEGETTPFNVAVSVVAPVTMPVATPWLTVATALSTEVQVAILVTSTMEPLEKGADGSQLGCCTFGDRGGGRSDSDTGQADRYRRGRTAAIPAARGQE